MVKLKVAAPLDPAFAPIYREMQAFAARAAKGPEIRIAVERNDGLVATHDMRILPEGEDDALNLRHGRADGQEHAVGIRRFPRDHRGKQGRV